ncbi:MAG: PKD domain-containing protein [Pseudomonadota bacterium]
MGHDPSLALAFHHRKRDNGRRRSALGPLLSGLLLSSALLSSASSHANQFQEVSNSLGITYTGTTFGSAWGDVNGDGRPDLWLGNHSSPHILYVNTESGFTPFNGFVGVSTNDMHGGAFADFDNDGDQDLLVTSGAEIGLGEGPNQLMVNHNGQLTQQAASYGLDYPLARARHVNWVDWNNDGRLDVILIATNQRNNPPQAPSRVFTYNAGTNTFVEETWTIHDKNTTTHAQLMFGVPLLGGQSAFSLNHNKSDFPDFIWQYGSSGLTDATSAFAFPELNGVRDVALGDFDNDGDTDMFTSSQNESGHLLLQEANGLNDDTSNSSIVFSHGIFVVTADFDNDKDLDIYVGRSHISNDTNQTNTYIENNGDGTFTEDTSGNGAAGTTTGFISSVTTADYNGDGFIDILTTNSDNWWTPATTGPVQLFENQGNGNNWLMLDLVGTASNRDGIGATVELTSGGTTQLREQNNGIHHRSQNHKRLHFGLGSDSVVSSLTVTWPSGTVQTLTNIAVNQIVELFEDDPTQPNMDPIPQGTATPVLQTLMIEFSSAGSYDPDGMITGYVWDFGDGNTSTDRNPTHTYANVGQYTATLTVTDDAGATGVQMLTFDVQVEVTIEAAGSNASSAGNAIDDVAGEQDLSTFWTSSSTLADAWLTIDMGAPANVVQVLLAPRGDRDYVFEITVSDTLSGGKATGGPTATCATPGDGPTAPSSMTPCNVPFTTGRYVTIVSTNRANLRLYGVEVVEGSLANQPPLGSFTATPQGNTLVVQFDGSASTDSDGLILSYDWDFGDGNTASGPTAQHTFAAEGTYTVSLTMIDSGGGSGTISVDLPLSLEPAPVYSPTLQAVGQTTGAEANLLDTLGDGSQNLQTKWENANSNIDDAWVTVDLGQTQTVASVKVAPRSDRSYGLDINIGDNLDANGQVTGGVTTGCTTADVNVEIPTELFDCAIPDVNGRFVSIVSKFRSKLPIYGIAVYGPEPAPGANSPPDGQASTSQRPLTLTVDFDASASTDSDGTVISVAWDFGDGNGALGTTAAHTYANDVDRIYTTAVRDDDEALHAFQTLLDVTPLPEVPSFLTHPQSQLVEVGSSVTFSAVVVGSNPIAFQWRADGVDIPGATSASYTSTGHTLADDGTLLTLVASNPAGTTVSQPATLSVEPMNMPPSAAFTVTPTNGIIPLAITVDGSGSSDSDGTVVGYTWSFGDGFNGSGQSLFHTYLVDGTYTITLTVTDEDGASASTTQTVVADPPVLPSITNQPQPQSILVGEGTSFSVAALGTPPLSYQWRKNGVDLPAATGTSFTLASAGLLDDGDVYSVRVSNAAGNVVSNGALLSVNAPPTPAFSVTPDNAPIPFTATFDATASIDIDGSIAAYDWDFGDGSAAGSGETTTHTYTSDGNFTVTLMATDDEGAAASTTRSVRANIRPIADFSASTTLGLAPVGISFDATASVDPDGSITSYAWTFGDGNIGAGPTPSHTFGPGTWTVTLTVTDNDGAQHSVSMDVIGNQAPVPAFSVDNPIGLVPHSITVDASSSTDPDAPADSIASYSWNFGDGTTASGVSASNTYTTAGIYIVTLTVTDSRGESASTTQQVVANLPPVANFTASPEVGLIPLAVTVDGAASSDPNGTVDSYAWDFGDGATASGQIATHSYAAVGSYTITLTVTDNDGATNTTTRTVIANTPPSAAFSTDALPAVAQLPFAFDASASSDANGTIEQYDWDFGDGGSATGTTTSHTYASAGTYTVTLTVTDNNGATDSASQTLVVDPLLAPVINAQPQDVTIPNGATATFNVTASGTPPLSYQWFRDGNALAGETGTSFSVAAFEPENGAEFTVSVTNVVTTVTSQQALLTVIQPPVVTQPPQSVSVEEGSTVVFDVQADGSTPFAYQWARNGNAIPGATDATLTLSSVSIGEDLDQFSVTLSNLAATVTSASATLDVFQRPVANFSSQQIENTLGFDFDGSASTDGDGSVASYDWDFGDGSSATGANTSHQYAAEGEYTVTLLVTDNEGKQDSTQQTLTAMANTEREATGSHRNNYDPAWIDDLAPDGNQNLDTFWQNNGGGSNAWLTLDLGIPRYVNEVRIGPRGDRNYQLEITIGDVLDDGQVSGAAAQNCVPPGGPTKPVALSSCPTEVVLGRYVTVVSSNVNTLRVYGVEIGYQDGPGNMDPVAVFTSTPIADTRSVDFDGQGSSDSDGTIVAWNWDFGDGNSATGPTVSHEYAANGDYSVTLSVTDDFGDTTSTTQAISINLLVPQLDWPFAVIAVGGNSAHSDRINDTDETGAQRLNTVWDNNGNLSTAWLTIDLGGPQNLLDLLIAPKGNSTYTFTITVGDTLAAGQVDGGASAICDKPKTGGSVPTELYSCPVPSLTGRYVTVRSNKSNYRVHGLVVRVEDTGQNNLPPSASIAFTQTQGTLEANFDGSASTDVDGSIVSYAWDFGDGASGTGATLSHTYAAAGDYTVMLTVTDDIGAGNTATQQITIDPLPVAPSITQQPQDLTVEAPNAATFTVGAEGTAPLTYQWFRDGIALPGATSSALSIDPTTVADSGALLTVTVSNEVGDTGSAAATLTVEPPNMAPTASFSTTPASGDAPLVVAFNALTSSDADGSIVGYAWDFGDGNTGDGSTTSHTYNTPGGYTATLTVTDDDGASATASATINVTMAPTAPTITTAPASVTVTEGQPASFSVAASGFPAPTLQWRRDGSDLAGQTGTSLTLAATALADDGASFTVVASNAAGSVESTPAVLTVEEFVNADPVAAVSGAPRADGFMFDFDASGSSDSDGTIVEYQWDFGDGNSASGPSATTTHSYAAEGTYTVTLTVVDDMAGSDSTTIDVTAQEVIVISRVDVTLTAVGARNSVSARLLDTNNDDSQNLSTYWNSGSGGGLAVAWFTLDLGSTMNISEVLIAPRADKGHVLELSVGDTLTSNQVAAAPAGQCTTPDLGNVTVPTVLNACPLGGAFGRYLTVRSLNQTNFRVYGVEVYASSQGPANVPPTADFDVANSAGSLQVDLDAGASSDSDGTIVSYAWDLGDGTSLSGAQRSHGYAAAGTYTVTLTVTDDAGATDTSDQSVTVTEAMNNPPSASLTASQVAGGLDVDFDASGSSDADGSIVQYDWDFGDGGSTTTSDATLTHSYAAAGTYTATVTVQDDEGATDTASVEIEVSTTTDPVLVPIVATDAGSSAGSSDDTADVTASGEQDLSSRWTSNAADGTDAAWVTFDLGTSAQVVEIHLAPRGDRNYNVGLYVGDTLAGGRVDGPELSVCSFPGNQPRVPTTLTVCTLPSTLGRFVTVQSRNFATFRLHGTEIYAQ